MPDELKKSQMRAIQYFYVDGTFEFSFGFLCLLLAIYFYLAAHVQGWLSAIVEASLVLVTIGGAVLVNRLIKRFKEHLTWPRTGYVSYQRKQGVQRGRGLAIGLVIGGVVGAVTTVLAMTQDLQIAVMPLLSGFLFGMVMVFLGWRTSILRFYLLSLLSAALGVALAVVLFFTGTCVLRTFLRKNPMPKVSPDEQ
ncbi:MAG: hypothetical protein NTV38_01585 [Chloroflexi bacterium]|nr:hypothetical protein [Chloroflexota bacterium]